MPAWQEYKADNVAGTLKVLEDVRSEELGNHRNLLVLLPPSWPETGRRWPVLYMQDGQNLFDAATSFAGEWGVDETMAALAQEGVEAMRSFLARG